MKTRIRFFIILIAAFVLLGLKAKPVAAGCDTGWYCTGERKIDLEHHCEPNETYAYCVQRWVVPQSVITCPDLVACSYSFTIYGVKCANNAQPPGCPEVDAYHSGGCCELITGPYCGDENC